MAIDTLNTIVSIVWHNIILSLNEVILMPTKITFGILFKLILKIEPHSLIMATNECTTSTLHQQI